MTKTNLLTEVIVMGFREDSYCGLFCGVCDLLLSTREGSLEDPGKRIEILTPGALL
ncbi:MAG: hypothetical protein XE05_0528 [Thermotogales bacterium 46_20]|nr:MAG: hypothetical protein XE05_0528 [Thermotogales bacterium 46_20]